MSRPAEVEVGGRRLKLSNLGKVLYPQAGFTKAGVIDYYTRVSPVLLPHLRGRPLTLKRYPDGVEGDYFYEKQCPSHAPDWVRTAALPGGDRQIDYCLVDGLPTLVWLANLADLELHTPLAVAEDMATPTVLAFDLDPGPPAAILECAAIAIRLRDLFAGQGLQCLAKTSGSKGMQVYVPLNTPAGFERTGTYARAVAQALERHDPELAVSRMDRALRAGRVFIDWGQNHRSKTTVCVYSLRAMASPRVSTPLSWDEVEDALAASDATALSFEAADVLERVERHGDLFAPALELEQELPLPART